MLVWYPSRERRVDFTLTGVVFQPDIVGLGLLFSGAWIAKI